VDDKSQEPRKLDAEDFTRMNLPAELWDVTLEGVTPSVAQPVRTYIEKIDEMFTDGVGFTFSGGAGVGKSGTAAVLAKAVRSRRHPVHFITIADLRESIRARSLFDDTISIFERCRSVEFLVLDALRQADAEDIFLKAVDLERLVEHRVAWKRPTIITTRLTGGECAKSFGGVLEAVKARSLWVEVAGEDRRAKGQENLNARLFPVKK
jgi:DNA replication protein DnaC